MVDLLKAFGRGILYVLLFPFFIAVLAVFAVIGLLAFIFQLFKSIIFFFTGQKFFPELPEDKKLRLMREAEEAARNPQPQPQPQVNNYQSPVQNQKSPLVFEEQLDEQSFLDEPESTPLVQPIPQPTTVEQACFQEEIKPTPAPTPMPEPAPAPVQPEPVMEKEVLKSDSEADDAPLSDFLDPLNDEPKMRDEQNEILEVYKPRGNNDSFEDDYEDDTDSGVNIRFDD